MAFFFYNAPCVFLLNAESMWSLTYLKLYFPAVATLAGEDGSVL